MTWVAYRERMKREAEQQAAADRITRHGRDTKAPPNTTAPPVMVLCPLCAVHNYDEDDRPAPSAKGPGCTFCNWRGEVRRDMKVPSIFSRHTVSDLLEHMRR